MNIILMGPPGAGKGTQSEQIVKEYGIPHISTGDMFRSAMASGSELGLLAGSFIKEGALVPDDVTIQIVKDRLIQDDCKKGYLLDGFPRTLTQAIALKKLSDEINRPIEFVINLKADKEQLIARIGGRRVCPKCGSSFHMVTLKPKKDGICDNCGSELILRPDDNPTSFKVRLEAYESKTFPLIEFYRESNLLREVNGLGSVQDVFKSVKDVLEGK